MATGLPVTIADMAAAQPPNLKRGTLEWIADKFALSDILPFTSTSGALHVMAARINPDGQPSALYRNINSDGKFVSGTMEPITETLKIMHEAIKIDKYIQGDSTYLFKPSTQVEFVAEVMSLEMMNAFLNGDPTATFNTDGSGVAASQPKGLRPRLRNAATEGLDQDVYTLGITGTNIDLSGTITATIGNDFADSLKELQTQTHANTLFVNYRARTRMERAWRMAGLLKTTEDALGRTWDTIFGMRVVETALKAPARRLRNTSDTSNWVQPREDNAGALSTASGAYTTLMAAYVGVGHVEGLTAQGMQQEGPIKLPPPTEAFAYQMSYGFGFMVNSFRDIGGLYGVKIF